MRPFFSLGAVAALATTLTACGGIVERDPDLIAGKQAFVEKCGSCHVLARAGTKGNQGPDLDVSFARALADGMRRSTVEGVVKAQIKTPKRGPQYDPETLKPLSAMPANLVRGSLARDVAAYVASAAARRGEDTGRLADIGVKKATAVAKAENGTLDIPADPGGQLVYEFGSAEAEAGQVKITSKNDSGTPHNIAVDGNGIDEKGEVVQDGGVSEITVTLEPGTYSFYCSVPGHREGGMEGKLAVK